ncbi:hypothetical protein CR513_01537, partial [Mucuna pruriens]
MAKEILALEENKTWILTDLLHGKRTIDSKWVYKVKYNLDDIVEHYKACLVAKGFTQIEGVDFHKTFVPVSKLIPQGFACKGEHNVCWLQKSLYELYQASRNWYKKFTSLITIGYQQLPTDHSLIISHHGGSFIVILIYVDDVIITGTNSTLISSLKCYLDDKFHIKDFRKLKYFFGIEVVRSPIGIALCQ